MYGDSAEKIEHEVGQKKGKKIKFGHHEAHTPEGLC